MLLDVFKVASEHWLGDAYCILSEYMQTCLIWKEPR